MLENIFAKNQLFIGCSGYHYKNWKGTFYPHELPTQQWLAYYSKTFNTMELNNTFYKVPSLKALENWREQIPFGHKLAVKMHRQITHYQRFTNVDSEISNFYRIAAEGLQDKLGPILFQLPPSYTYSFERLRQILMHINVEFDNVVEFRHASWWNPTVYELLSENNVTFCSVSYPGLPSEVVKTSPVGYIRLHGDKELFKSTYTQQELSLWAEKIKAVHFKETYIYFNNTWFSGALENAKEMMELMQVHA